MELLLGFQENPIFFYYKKKILIEKNSDQQIIYQWIFYFKKNQDSITAIMDYMFSVQ